MNVAGKDFDADINTVFQFRCKIIEYLQSVKYCHVLIESYYTFLILSIKQS